MEKNRVLNQLINHPAYFMLREPKRLRFVILTISNKTKSARLVDLCFNNNLINCVFIAELPSRAGKRQPLESMTSSVHRSRDQRTGSTDFSIDRLIRTENPS